MGAEILVNVRPNQTRVAFVEDEVVTDLKIEHKVSPTLVGSIYRGKVVRVLPGMQAAFVDIGLDRAAFLYVGDVRSDLGSQEPNPYIMGVVGEVDLGEENETKNLDNSSPNVVIEEVKVAIQDLVHEGQHLLVQVAKDPLGTKGARITTHISLPGRHIVYMPTVSHLGISRKIEDEMERERLRKAVEELNPSGGMIVRTAGEGASVESLKADLLYLEKIWREILKNYEKKKSPCLVYSELEVELRALRDLLDEGVSRVLIDDSLAHRRTVNFVNQFMPKFKNIIEFYEGKEPLFDLYDIDLEISHSLDRKVWLKSGGYIVFDEAEALVVIDVNTGRFVGKKDLEDTILKTNLEAVKEIAHQLRIRNCGGIIIIDFIDMEKESHREKVLHQLGVELQKDKARTSVVSMTSLGLVEMTRKRIRPSLVSTLCEPCPYCEGKSYIKRKRTMSSEIFRALEREEFHGDPTKFPVVHCHGDVADYIYAEEVEMLDFIEKKMGRSVVFKVEPGFHLEQFEIFCLQRPATKLEAEFGELAKLDPIGETSSKSHENQRENQREDKDDKDDKKGNNDVK
ncbi:MAG: Rne/Rng family ribonuclease [Bdellovibrionales bacterium]|nr:Rne/Rng family ribonuclease [Bdellovibrionales bacterium]